MTIRTVIIHTMEPICSRTRRYLSRRINPIPQPTCWLF